MRTQIVKRINRKRPKIAVGNSFYLPRGLSIEIERVAIERYGGNKSALVTEKLAEALNWDLSQEVDFQLA